MLHEAGSQAALASKRARGNTGENKAHCGHAERARGPGAGTSPRNASVSRGLPASAAWAARLLALEFVTVTAVAYATSKLYHHLVIPDATVATEYFGAGLALAALYCASTLGLGDIGHLQSFRWQRLLWDAVCATTLAFCFLVSGMFLLKISDEYSRGAFLAQFITVCVATVAIRGILIGRQQHALENGRLAMRRAFLIGDSDQSEGLAKHLGESGIVAVAHLPFAMVENGSADESSRKLIERCRSLCVDDIFVLPKANELTRIKTLLDQLSQLPVEVHVMIPGLDDLLTASEILQFGDVATMKVQGRPLSTTDEILKRGFDLVFAVLFLVALSPIMLMAAGLVKLTSRGPVLFRQVRHGYNNQAITVLKFRTMRIADQDEAFRQATRNDERVTWIGAILRASSIDELPQFFNVLRGEMSIVGPRPHALAHNKMFEERIPPLSRRHNVKPGLTGWAQVNLLRGETDTLEKMQKRIDFDLFYIDNWSFHFDLKVIAMTALLLLSPKNYRETY